MRKQIRRIRNKVRWRKERRAREATIIKSWVVIKGMHRTEPEDGVHAKHVGATFFKALRATPVKDEWKQEFWTEAKGWQRYKGYQTLDGLPYVIGETPPKGWVAGQLAACGLTKKDRKSITTHLPKEYRKAAERQAKNSVHRRLYDWELPQ